MCGLVGTAGQGSGKNDDIVKTLLILDQLRGFDSTGVAFIRATGEDVEVVKDAVLPPVLLELDDFKKNICRVNRAVIGHNRAATKGAVNKENAHPFHVGSIVGAHNGTLHSMKHLPDFEMFDNDSHCLFNAINDLGIKDAWARMEGAAAITWWDQDERTINFARNSLRPLFLYIDKDTRRSMWWASEAWMLHIALSRNGIKCDNPFEIKPNTHYAFKYSDNKGFSYTETELLPFVYPSTTNHRSTTTNYPKTGSGVPTVKEDGGDCNSRIITDYTRRFVRPGDGQAGATIIAHPASANLSKKERKRLARFNKTSSSARSRMENPKHIKDHLGRTISKKDFNKTYKQCCFCDNPLSFEDKKILILTEDKAICGSNDCRDMHYAYPNMHNSI